MYGRRAVRRKADPLVVRIRFYIVALALLILTWSVGFMVVERRSFADAVYFTFITVTTVGYGDVHPVSLAGKVMAVLIILTGTGMFGGLVASVTELLLNRRERGVRREKLNLVIGAFLSEVGTKLLVYFSGFDSRVEQIKSDLFVSGDWTDEHFQAVAARIGGYDYHVDAAHIDFERVRVFLAERRGFMLRLLENPTLMEHEEFTDLLLAVFHLTEELSHRTDLSDLPESDQAHLAGDVKLIYGLLVHQWLDHLRYLRLNYPNLFSLAIRTNPFDERASPIVTG